MSEETCRACAGVLCGAAASGNFTWTPEHVAQSLVCMVMSGPLLTGYTQTINDYYDREIDAINEPNRPIPSGSSPCPSCHGPLQFPCRHSAIIPRCCALCSAWTVTVG